jgi:conjugal transfer/entry exclusion protein
MDMDMYRRRFLEVLASGIAVAALSGEGVAKAAPLVSTSIALNGTSGGCIRS